METRVLLALLVLFCLLIALPVCAGDICVKGDSPFDGPGNDWEHAYHTIQSGLSAAASGDRVLVAAGAYSAPITLKDGVQVLGGYQGIGDVRDVRLFKTALTGVLGTAAVSATAGVSSSACLDGFTITGGNAAAISCVSSSPVISNNYITSTAGIYLDDSSSVISDCTLTRNSGYYAGAIYCYRSSPSILNCIISENTSNPTMGSGAVYAEGQSTLTVTGGRITGNSESGIRFADGSATISNVVIAGNGSNGIQITGAAYTVSNCSINGNGASGIYSTGMTTTLQCTGCTLTENSNGGINSYARITAVNNIIAFNSFGVLVSVSGSTFANNCVYGNHRYNYTGVIAGTGHMVVDPKLAAREYGEVHLLAGSPCINAGDDSVAGTMDIDGQPRINGAHVDIGADEYDGTVYTHTPIVVRVSPSGDDANTGESWALAKRTIQAGINAASAAGGEVWVTEGTYAEAVRLKAFAYVYGGFTGSETERTERDYRNRRPAIAMGAGSTLVTAQAGWQVSGLDGFILSGGYRGIVCGNSAPFLRNNLISGHSDHGIYMMGGSPDVTGSVVSGNAGSGIYCYSRSYPVISGNVVSGNGKGGIYVWYYCSPTITNNTIVGNNEYYNGGGVHVDNQCYPMLSNNIIAFNQSGVHLVTTSPGSVTLRNNCVFGNTRYDYLGMSPGSGDFSLDPLLLDRVDGDYHIVSGSPCINAGLNSASGIPSEDMDGQQRIQSSAVDVGADEFTSGASSLGEAKLAADYTWCETGSVVTTLSFADLLYVEHSNRSTGIRVSKTAHGIAQERSVRISGMIRTNDDGERYIAAYRIHDDDDGHVDPICMGNLSVGGGANGLQQGVCGGTGLGTIGLLARTWGRVTELDPEIPRRWFKVDDGSGVGVRCVVPEGVAVDPAWTFAVVTGAISCERAGDVLNRVLLVRDSGDVVAY